MIVDAVGVPTMTPLAAGVLADAVDAATWAALGPRLLERQPGPVGQLRVDAHRRRVVPRGAAQDDADEPVAVHRLPSP
ncbi:MAG TPA: hypothetical protein VEL73_01020, partial [Mycobacteriales bacterium]|nr:hypothetical protein [Mycobacteriales bacterium]